MEEMSDSGQYSSNFWGFLGDRPASHISRAPSKHTADSHVSDVELFITYKYIHCHYKIYELIRK